MSPALMTVTVAAPSGIVRIFLFCMVVCSLLMASPALPPLHHRWRGGSGRLVGASPATTFYTRCSERCRVVLVGVGVALGVGKIRVKVMDRPVAGSVCTATMQYATWPGKALVADSNC